MKNKRAFGELESTILHLIKNKKRATVSEIHNLLKKEVAYTTVLTVMKRLFEKNYLKREKTGRSYTYYLDSNYRSVSLNLLNRLKEKLFSGSPVEMISHLLKDPSKVTFEELDKIDLLIKKAKKKRKK